MAEPANEALEQTGEVEEDLVRGYTSLQCQFLVRLRWLRDLRNELDSLPSLEPWIGQLVRRAIYSTLCDCLSVGVGDKARQILAGAYAGSEHG
jgi:hypothetical protein